MNKWCGENRPRCTTGLKDDFEIRKTNNRVEWSFTCPKSKFDWN